MIVGIALIARSSIGMGFAPTRRMAKTRRKTVEDATTMTGDHDRVAVRAYELYVARGCGEGQDLDDWLCAERELNSASNAEAQTYRDRDES
jgi:hypothetical protein